MFNKTVALAAFLSLLTLPCMSAAQHGHDDGHADMLVGGDSAGVGNLLIDYPFGERPVVRVSDSGAPEGLFTAVDPGFDRAEDEPAEGVFELPSGTEISLEVVALDDSIQLTLDNGVDPLAILANPGDTAVIGQISDGECDAVLEECIAGDIGAPCHEDYECSTLSPDIHNHPEFQLLLLAEPDEFAEGDVLFKVTNTDAAGYGESEVYKLTLSNGHLPHAEFEDAADDKEKKDRAKCLSTVGKEVRKLTADHYKRLTKCMDALVGAEELGGSESKVDAACSLSSSDKGVVGRLEDKRTKAIAGIAKKCGPLGTSSEPFTARQINNHLGMATCRTQELVGGLYNGSLGMLEEHFSGECDSSFCDGGINDGMACSDDEDCSAEEDIEEAIPCLKMSQAAE